MKIFNERNFMKYNERVIKVYFKIRFELQEIV
jgi:hypothetical protein